MAKHTKPEGKGKKAAKTTGKAVVATARGTVKTAKAVNKAWNYCLPWPLGCGHSTRVNGCGCCAKHK